MKALRYENKQLRVAEVARPVGESEALVRVRLAGICNTDLEIVRGYAGFEGTLGHEFVGEVESAPGDASLVGRRVVGEINAGCGLCELCLGGDARHCPARTVLGIVGRDGAFAEFLRLPVSNLLAVPDEVPDERAVFAEPLAAACGITERVTITEGMRVCVIGDGKLGILCAQALKVLTGAQVTLVGKHRAKLDIAARQGVETLTAEKLPGGLRRSFDVLVEASGSSGGFRTALELLRPRGQLVLKSTFQGATDINAAAIVVDEISVVGSRCGRFAPALELLARDAVDVESLVGEEFPLTQGVRALERAAEPGVLKVLLRP
ncbi:MAG TPA: alcohol dehydrogenase catalytic domain-containing protein [Pyrinomonadaceae bacterium]|jgi:threonine dehydrogenase-like Zn-dependent dehydrogenase|nr:alcohol dehydrogenase catalytic domain-containing protein [Pyrinomonadaceae bacterium]